MSEWQKVKIGDIATESKIHETNPDANKKIRVRLNVNGVEKRPLIAEKEGATKNYKRKAGQFIYGRQNFHKGAFGVIPSSLDGFSSSGDLPAFDIDESCLPEWMLYWFKTENRYLQLLKQARGIGSQRIATADFYETEILLPDINIQKNIISKIQSVEKNTVLFDSEISNQQTYLTKLRQAILQEAIEGKLTADWRVKNPVEKGNPDFDAVALLATIKAEKQKLIAEGKIRKEKPLAPINPDDVPFALPEGWVWVRLGEIAEELSTGPFGSTLHKSDYVTDEIPLINPTNIVNGRIVANMKITISETTKTRLEKYVLKVGDFVIARRGDLSKCAIIQESQNGWICGTGSFFMRILSINKIFFQLAYTSSSSQKYLLKDSIGQTMDNLNQSLLSKLPLALPPLAEQHAIVERVDRLLASVNALEQQVKERKTYAQQLMQAVLKEAFAG